MRSSSRVSPPQIENLNAVRKSNFFSRWKWIFGALILLVAGAFAYWQFGSKAFEAKRTTRPVGFVNGCYKLPPFIPALNFSAQAALSTSEKSRPGLWLIERDQTGNVRRYQHPSWQSAGFLAPIQRDGKGNVFVAPAPVINTLLNPTDKQNIVYRVDGKTQEMKPFVTLKPAAPPNEQNPYGTLGLTFDCETNSLYVSSVYGSSRSEEKGIIYRIDADSGKITSQMPNVDAIGLGVFNGSSGKKIYFGRGRASEVQSIALDDEGNFFGTAQTSVNLADLGTRGDDKARRITFTNKKEMLVYGIEFSFNLVAPTEKQETIYRFVYDAKNDKWVFSPNIQAN